MKAFRNDFINDVFSSLIGKPVHGFLQSKGDGKISA